MKMNGKYKILCPIRKFYSIKKNEMRSEIALEIILNVSV